MSTYNFKTENLLLLLTTRASIATGWVRSIESIRVRAFFIHNIEAGYELCFCSASSVMKIYTDYMIKTDKLWELEASSYFKNDKYGI